MIPGSATPFLLAKSDGGFKIERSLRFDRPASSYLNRAFSDRGDRKTFTVSFWTKRTSIGNAQNIFNTSSTPGQTNSTSPRTEFRFNGTGSIKFAVNSSGSSWKALDTTSVFRDFSAWYHLVVSVDTTQTTEANRVKLYVNGVQQTLTGTYPALNEELPYNNNYTHTIGNYANNYNDYFDGYLADFHFIDGQALAPSDFGEYDNNNVWQPKKFAGNYEKTHIAPTYDSTYGSDITSSEVAKTIDGDLSTYGVPTGDFVGYTYSTSNEPFINIKWENTKSSSITVYIQPWVSGSAANSGTFDSSGGNSVTIAAGATLNTKFNFPSGYDGYFRVYTSGDGVYLRMYDTGGTRQFNSFHLDFSDNSTTAALGTDSSGLNNTWTLNNISAIDSDGAIYAEFSGSSNQYLRNNSGNVLPGSNGAFTIECHFYPHTTNVIGLFDGGSGSTSIIRNYGNNTIEKQSGGSVNFAGDYTQNAWNHIAVVYTGSTDTDTMTVYVNGVSSGYAQGLNGFSPGSTFDIGTINNGGDGRFDGYIRNFRVTHAVVYNSAFTAPSHTNNLPAITDTELLVLTTPANGLTGAGSGTTLGMSNNGSVTSGTLTPASETDSFIDTPTHYESGSGNPGGNYATFNPASTDINGSATLTNGNLKLSASTFGHYIDSRSTIAASSFDCYCEMKVTEKGAAGLVGLGIGDITSRISSGTGSYIAYRENGEIRSYPGNSLEGTVNSYTSGDVIGMAVSSSQVKFYKNGSLEGTFSHSLTGDFFVTAMAYHNGNNSAIDLNFGQRLFTISSVPTGYKSLCTTNLPEPTIVDGRTAMNTSLYTGNGSTNAITGVGHSPDILWIKSRSSGTFAAIADTVTGPNYFLRTNGTNALSGPGYNDDIVSFDSDGFTLGADTYYAFCNQNNTTYAAWTWDSGSSNTTVAADANGSGLPGAACEYRVNPSTGCSVVKVANPTSTQARVHGLNKKPDLIICKSTGSTDSWHTYHSSLGYTKYINLNGTGGATSSDQFGSQEPTSTYFYVKANTGSGANKSGGMIYYIWTAIEGYSAFGSYTGDGNSDGPFVYTGFRPRFLLYKRSDGSDTVGWILTDSERNPHNVVDDYLAPNAGSAEGTTNIVDFLSNGFRMRIAGADGNVSGGTYIYACFAEHPFKNARAR